MINSKAVPTHTIQGRKKEVRAGNSVSIIAGSTTGESMVLISAFGASLD